MGQLYIVQSGDTLVKIAQEHGYESWRDIYYHPENEDFRRRRPDPDRIYPGDELILPDRPGGGGGGGGEEPPTQPPPTTPPTTKVVTARDGDTLCTIASDNGFRNCRKLRDANPELRDRQLRPGDEVIIPEVTRKEETGQTEMTHEFERLGQPRRRIWIIQDLNRPTPPDALADEQSELAVSNFVPTRQGAGVTTGNWRDHTFFGHDGDASTDPDHFKVQVFDPGAKDDGETEVKITLQTQKPALNAQNQIERWENMTEAGTKLEDVVCQQVEADSPWYRSHYLRLVVDTQDQTAKRPHGRTSPTADPGTDVSKQTLVTPKTTDNRIEILDLRVIADRLNPDCGATNPDAICRARTTADVGKSERVLRIKVYRIGGASGTGISDNDIDTMIYTNYRSTLAQANVGVELVDNRIHDVPLPRNMIAVSDYNGVKASGGGTMRVRVSLSTGQVEASIETQRKHTPQETASRLVAALRARGVRCRMSTNPPVQSSSESFGSCDILCFNTDDTPARVLSATSNDSDQKLAHTGNWLNNHVRNARSQYGVANGRDAQMVGSLDYRAAAKSYNTDTGHLCVMLVNDFASGTLLGEALLPYRDVRARLRPRRDYSMAVFLDQGGATRRTVLTHEAGHVLLDAFHTTSYDRDTNTESDWDGSNYDDNAHLAYSEWMSAINREPNLIHKRMSDNPLTVKYAVVRKNVNNLQAVIETMGGANPSPVARFRTLSASVLGNLRRLQPAPGANL